MAILGRINFGFSITADAPVGMTFIVAVDGTHHTICKDGFFTQMCQIACAETLTEAATVITEADWRGHVAAKLGIVDGIGGSGVVASVFKVACPGTPYFIIMGNNFNDDEGLYQIFGILYRLNASGDYDVLYGYHYYNALGAGPEGLLVDGTRGQRVIGNEVFFLAEYRDADGDFQTQLTRLPINEDGIVLVPDSWKSKRYNLPGPDFNTGLWWIDTIGASLFEHPDGVRVVAYLTPETWETVVHTGSIAPGTNTGQNDVSATFGTPFADEGKNFAGDPSAFVDDIYQTPSINILDDGRIEISYLRGASDELGMVGLVRIICEPDFSNPIVFDLQWYDIGTSLGVLNFEAGHLYREGNLVTIMIKEDAALTFGQVEIAIDVGECASSGFDLVYPPCVTAWTQCVKIQRRDDVSFRFTSLDRDIEFRGETYATCGGLDPSATQVTAQTGEVGSSELAGLMVATGVKETELYGGLFDDAFVEIWLVPFDEPGNASSGDGGLPRRLAAGWAGKVTHSTRGYKMEVLGPGARLDQRPIVQVYSPQCRWVFGDERCGIDIEALAITGSVTSGLNRGLFLATLGPEASSGTGAAASSGELAAQFANGRVRWLTGVNAGQVTEVKSVDFDTGQIILWALTCFVPEVGDTFDLLPGCAQDFPTCRDLYDNALNFGGFPYVPGRDAIMESPSAKVG